MTTRTPQRKTLQYRQDTMLGRMYHWWLQNGGGIKPGYKENFCHYLKVMLIQAPWLWLWKASIDRDKVRWMRPWMALPILGYIVMLWVKPDITIDVSISFLQSLAIVAVITSAGIIGFYLLIHSIEIVYRSLRWLFRKRAQQPAAQPTVLSKLAFDIWHILHNITCPIIALDAETERYAIRHKKRYDSLNAYAMFIDELKSSGFHSIAWHYSMGYIHIEGTLPNQITFRVDAFGTGCSLEVDEPRKFLAAITGWRSPEAGYLTAAELKAAFLELITKYQANPNSSFS